MAESADTVAPGVLQLETSVTSAWDHTDEGRMQLWSTPTLFRVGALPGLELRLETDGALYESDSSASEREHHTGVADGSLGIKFHPQNVSGFLGRLAWVLNLDIPWGSPAFRAGGAVPSLRVGDEFDITEHWGLGLVPGVAWEIDDEGRRYVAAIAVLDSGYQFTERLHGFIEISGNRLATPRHGGSDVTADTGFSYLLNNDMQVDAAIYRGITDAADDLTATIGFSVRW